MKKKAAGKLKYNDKENWGRLISIAKKHLDIWSHQNINFESGDMKLSFLPVIFNISPDGNTNSELSKRSLIAKQAMSRTIKELEERGLVITAPLTNDKRSYKINLTATGKKFVESSTKQMSSLIGDYISLVGIKKFGITLEVLSNIIDFHEKINSTVNTED